MRRKNNPNRDDSHVGAKKGVPALANSVIRIFRYLKENDKDKAERSYKILAQKLIQRKYSIQVFQKYWGGKKLTDSMLQRLALEHDILLTEQKEGVLLKKMATA